MSKYASNIYAFANGTIKTLYIKIICNKSNHINKGLRLFHLAKLSVYRKAKCQIGSRVKIDGFANVVCCNDAKLSIGNNVGIGAGNCIICKYKISIGSNTIFGPNVLIYDHDHKFDSDIGVERKEYTTDEVIIGENCWIGAGTIILKGTHIGDRCIIGAGSVIKGNIPDGSKVIQRRETKIF